MLLYKVSNSITCLYCPESYLIPMLNFHENHMISYTVHLMQLEWYSIWNGVLYTCDKFYRCDIMLVDYYWQLFETRALVVLPQITMRYTLSEFIKFNQNHQKQEINMYSKKNIIQWITKKSTLLFPQHTESRE